MRRVPVWLILLVVGLPACRNIPDYPLNPQISFNSVRFEDNPQTDYIYLNLDFKDGDGDLGLSTADLSNPLFAEFYDSAGTEVPNPNRFNIFPVLLRKSGDVYLPELPPGFYGTFPRLREGDSRGPVSGTLRYRMPSFYFFGQDSTIAKVRVFIQDRALNRSNVIETPPFPVVNRR
jgi:hypothetical protein